MRRFLVTLVGLAAICIAVPAVADLLPPEGTPRPAPEDAPPAKPSSGCAATSDGDSFWQIVASLGLAVLVPLVSRRSNRGTLVVCEGSSEQRP